MIRILLALAGLMFIVPAAQAASFDCSKAATTFEKVICDHQDLSSEDEILAQAYATALGGLSTDAATTLKATQHGWLDYAASACGDDGQPIPGAYTDDQAQCLLTTLKDRVTTLEASKMQGSYRFYPVEGYLVEKDPDSDTNSFNKVATKHFLRVKMDRADDLAAAFNAWTEKQLLGQDVQMGEDSHLFEKGSTTLAKGNTSADIDVTATVKTVTSARITLSTDAFWYGHGAAHGIYASGYDHFLIADERPLAAADIFKGKGWEKKLATLVIARLKEQLGEDYMPDGEKDMSKTVADPERWDFSEDGLIVQFLPYEVAAYAVGAPTVTVPWSALTGLLADDASTITSSF